MIALWKDPIRGVREIPLEPDAHGVLVSASADRATRRSSDGRRPVQNGSEFFDVSVYQVRAASSGSGRHRTPAGPPFQPLLEVNELTILLAWGGGTGRSTRGGARTRRSRIERSACGCSVASGAGIQDPCSRLDQAIGLLDEVIRVAKIADAPSGPDAVLAAIADRRPSEPRLARLAHLALRAAIEQRQARRASVPG